MAPRKRKYHSHTERILASDGALCVTFANAGQRGRRSFDSYADLVGWALEHGALEAAEADRLESDAGERPQRAEAALRHARAVHAATRRVLVALGTDRKPAAADFAAFNSALRAALGNRQLRPTASGYRWSWGQLDDDLDRMLWPVLESAGSLLAEGGRRRVRLCQQPECGLLFVARGGGKARKWCGTKCRNRRTSIDHYHKVIKPRRRALHEELEREQKARLAGYGEAWQPSEETEGD